MWRAPLANPFDYLGDLSYQREPDLGMFYAGKRWLGPTNRQWLSVDPMAGVADPNGFGLFGAPGAVGALEPRYLYARNAPNQFVDPTGGQPEGRKGQPDRPFVAASKRTAAAIERLWAAGVRLDARLGRQSNDAKSDLIPSVSDATRGLWQLSLDDVSNSFATADVAIVDAFSFGHVKQITGGWVDPKKYTHNPGYGGSNVAAHISRDAAALALGVGGVGAQAALRGAGSSVGIGVVINAAQAYRSNSWNYGLKEASDDFALGAAFVGIGGKLAKRRVMQIPVNTGKGAKPAYWRGSGVSDGGGRIPENGADMAATWRRLSIILPGFFLLC